MKPTFPITRLLVIAALLNAVAAQAAPQYNDTETAVLQRIETLLGTGVPASGGNGAFTGTFNGTHTGNGAGLTNVTATATGGNGAFTGTFNGTHTGNGTALTNLTATNLTTGTVPDARLSGNVVRVNPSSQVYFPSTSDAGYAVDQMGTWPHMATCRYQAGVNSDAGISMGLYSGFVWEQGELWGTIDDNPAMLASQNFVSAYAGFGLNSAFYTICSQVNNSYPDYPPALAEPWLFAQNNNGNRTISLYCPTTIYGNTTISGQIYGNSAYIAGNSVVTGQATAQTVVSNGNMTCNGTLSTLGGVLPAYPRSVASRSWFVLEEFFNGTSALTGGWAATNSGGATAATAVTTSSEFGLLALSTGTTASASQRSGVGTNLTALMLGGNRSYSFVMRVAPGTLADGTNTGWLLGGFGTVVSSVDSACIEWRSTNGGNWTCVTTSGGNSTTTTTSLDGGSGTYRTLSFLVDELATNVRFYNGTTLVATHTTNIPTVAMGARVILMRSAATSANLTATLDFAGYGYSNGSARWPQGL